MLPVNIIKNEYPDLGDTIYADVCQMGLPPRRTLEAGRDFWLGYDCALRKGEPTGLRETRELARTRLAELIGGKAEEIAFTKNTTEGLSILASGYHFKPGDNVVTCDLENPSNLFPWFNAAQRLGYEVRIAKTHQGRVGPDDLSALIDSRTKVVAISSVQAGTGYRADLASIAELCRKAGAVLAVDAIQSLGRLTLDAPTLGVDYVSCGGYKGLLSGFGIGFLWCRRELVEHIHPAFVGPQSAQSFSVPPQVTPDSEGFLLRTDAGRFEAGTHNAPGIAMLCESVGLLLELDPRAVEKHVLDLESRLRNTLEKSPLETLTPESPERCGGMVVAYYPPHLEPRLTDALGSRNIRLTHRPGYIRLAIGLHNTREDIDIIGEVLSL